MTWIKNIFGDSILSSVRGWVAGLFMVNGWVHGYGWPHVAAVVALFIIHHWPDIVAEVTKVKADADSGDVASLVRDVQELRDRVGVLSIAATLKKPAPAGNATPGA